ncbi:type II secretion system F family protein [Candidatus Bathyarchaeota archaeon]|nr:type II secretion system F family protein [Candidatus Bathyarchaeota archaeon]
MYFEKREQWMASAGSIFVGLVIFAAILLQRAYVPEAPYWVPLSQRTNNGIILCILLALSLPSVLEYQNSRWLKGVEKNVPLLLRDVSEAVQSGVPLITALEEASVRDYGPVSKPLENSLVRFNLTSDLKGSLKWLGEKLIKPSAKRMSTVLIEAYEAGGRVKDVLEKSVELFTSISDYKEERASQTSPYVAVVYIGNAVFLVISWVVVVRFLQPLSAATADPLVAQSGVLASILDINYYKSILFWASTMGSLLGGLIAGKISDGRVAAGLIHSEILLLLTLVFYNLFSV